MSYLLEYAGKPSKIIFKGKVTDFEFTGKIGDIEINNNSRKRDRALIRLGKKISKRPLFNLFSRLRFEIWKLRNLKQKKVEPILTDEEIAELIRTIERGDIDPMESTIICH